MGIWFGLKEPHTDEEIFSDNITHNLGKMAAACDLYQPIWRLEELGIKYAKDLIPYLSKGLSELVSKPEEYSKYNAPNGWGTYPGFVRFISSIYVACLVNPDLLIEVDR